MLQTQALTFSYSSAKTFSFPDLSLGKGEQVLVTGLSGAGKSTFLRLLAGFIPANGGSVKVLGNELVGASVLQRDRIRAQHMGIVSQRPNAIKALTALENMMLIPYLTSKKVAKEKALTILADLGIDAHRDSKPQAMSVGEQQRLGIAMAALHNPDIILADEPTSSLDSQNCEQVLQLLKAQVKKTEATLVIVTHDNRLISEFDKRIEL